MPMNESFPLLMVSAMYENGGNTTHRLLDGHPQAFVYPFESQLGTKLVVDQLTSMFPVKYRWPEFALTSDPRSDFKSIIDEETRVRARTPHVSKFRHVTFELDDDERADLFEEHARNRSRSRGDNVAAFFRATFDAWKNYARTGREEVYIGYSPVVIVDGHKILSDLPSARILHVVRNPWSAYADTKKRPVPLPLDAYMLAWVVNQHFASLLQNAHPKRVHIIRAEDVMAEPQQALGAVCDEIGLERSDTLATPSWNGQLLDEVYPWGTIREATAEANRKTADELSAEEVDRVRGLAGPYLEIFDYADFLEA